MARWVETKSFRWTFKEKHTNKESKNRYYKDGIWQNNYWGLDYDHVDEALKELSSYCDANQYEIKSIVPLQRAQSHEYQRSEMSCGQGWGAGWGAGYGWGITMTNGFMALVQRVEDISQEEFDTRMNHRKEAAEEKTRLEKEAADLKARLKEEAVEKTRKQEIAWKAKKELDELIQMNKTIEPCIDASIEYKKGLLSATYSVLSHKFKNEEAAEAFKEERKASFINNKEKIDALKDELLITTTVE